MNYGLHISALYSDNPHFTKAFGLLSKVIKLPQVVGALVAGII